MTIKADVEVLKTQIATIKSSFDDHVAQNREDFKEVHSRMSTMKREISDEINLTFEKLCDKIDINEIYIFFLLSMKRSTLLVFP